MAAVPVKADWISTLFANGNPPKSSKTDPASGLVLEMLGQASTAAGFSIAYDSYLLLKDGTQNHTLTLVLRIHLNPILPDGLPPAIRLPYFDSDSPPKMFLIRPWRKWEWSNFRRGFLGECAKWNDRFWLVPPADFPKLDVKRGGRTVRPNVYCHLHVAVVDGPAGAHRNIDVVNLDVQDAKRRHGLRDQDLDSSAFRSEVRTYDHFDVKTRTQPTQDHMGKWHVVSNYSTVVHEIGHALGLPHVGVTHGDPQCKIAVVLDEHAKDPSSLPALYHGGSNSLACSGHLGIPARGANVMGGGSSFDEANAAPWAARIALHTGTRPETWSVSRKKPPPKPV